MDFEQREEMMAADPEVYYITDQYLNYPWMIVRLAQVRRDALQGSYVECGEVGVRVMRRTGTRQAVAAAR
jgi:hypothetical protein